MTREVPTDRTVVKTLIKGLHLLDVVAEASRPVTLSEIAQRFQGDLGTIHRFLRTLVETGFVGYLPDDKRYYLGSKVLRLGRMFYSQHRIYDLAREEMIELSSRYGETVHLCVRSAIPGAILVDEIPGNHPTSISMAVGTRLPFHCSAAGKALLATRGPEVIERQLDGVELEVHTERTITSVDELRTEFEQIRSLGYASEDGEFAEGVRAIAAPIYNAYGEPVATLGVACPAPRVTRESLEESAPHARRLAEAISGKLGLESTEKSVPWTDSVR